LVRKARNKVFHLNCFTCMVCNKQLSTGEELYIIDENKFVCKEDFPPPLFLPSFPPFFPPHKGGKNLPPVFSACPLSCRDGQAEDAHRGMQTEPQDFNKLCYLGGCVCPYPPVHILGQLATGWEWGISLKTTQRWENPSSPRRVQNSLPFPRPMRPLGGRLDESEMLGSTPYTYYGDYQGDYYGPGGNYDFFPHGPPSQAQSPADSSYLQNSGPGSTPLGPLEPPLSGHHSSENQSNSGYSGALSHPNPELSEAAVW
ncbi:LHX5 protein, partial [Ibidorhyncha struthersii]|nr:LHX5 protein [Ibidorhyncha struthersii]